MESMSTSYSLRPPAETICLNHQLKPASTTIRVEYYENPGELLSGLLSELQRAIQRTEFCAKRRLVHAEIIA